MLIARLQLQVREDLSGVAVLLNREELMASLQQEMAREIHQTNPPSFKPYDPSDAGYGVNADTADSSFGEVEHLKASFSNEERRRLRMVTRVPEEFIVPASALANDFVEDVVRLELIKLLPICNQVGIRVAIER